MAVATQGLQILEAIDRAQVQSKRARPLLLFGLILLVAAFASLSIYLDAARKDAEQARDEAVEQGLQKSESANNAANALAAAAVSLRADDPQSALEIIERALPQQERVAGSSLPERTEQAAPLPDTDRPDQSQITSVLQEAAADTSKLELPAYPAGKAYQVYIQFAGSITRGKIVALNRALRDAGWNVQGPSGERIAYAAGLNEVRYAGEAEREAAQALAATLTDAGVGGSRVEARQLDVIRPGTLEAWISN